MLCSLCRWRRLPGVHLDRPNFDALEWLLGLVFRIGMPRGKALVARRAVEQKHAAHDLLHVEGASKQLGTEGGVHLRRTDRTRTLRANVHLAWESTVDLQS